MEPTNRIAEISENPSGLHRRYTISKTDGSPIDAGAEYFVLRLDDHGSDPKHVEACRAAILTYAQKIQTHIPKLADDIQKRYGQHAAPGLPKHNPKPLRTRQDASTTVEKSSNVQIGNDNVQLGTKKPDPDGGNPT